MILVSFRCENCGVPQSDIQVMDDDGVPDVTCGDCEHTVDVGVYLGPDWRELVVERDPPIPFTEEVPDADDR